MSIIWKALLPRIAAYDAGFPSIPVRTTSPCFAWIERSTGISICEKKSDGFSRYSGAPCFCTQFVVRLGSRDDASANGTCVYSRTLQPVQPIFLNWLLIPSVFAVTIEYVLSDRMTPCMLPLECTITQSARAAPSLP